MNGTLFTNEFRKAFGLRCCIPYCDKYGQTLSLCFGNIHKYALNRHIPVPWSKRARSHLVHPSPPLYPLSTLFAKPGNYLPFHNCATNFRMIVGAIKRAIMHRKQYALYLFALVVREEMGSFIPLHLTRTLISGTWSARRRLLV